MQTDRRLFFSFFLRRGLPESFQAVHLLPVHISFNQHPSPPCYPFFLQNRSSSIIGHNSTGGGLRIDPFHRGNKAKKRNTAKANRAEIFFQNPVWGTQEGLCAGPGWLD